MTPQNQTVPFMGNQLTLIYDEQKNPFIAMKSVVLGIGLSWSKQREKLMKYKEKFSWALMGVTASDGKTYEMLCIPLAKLNGWLFSINPEKVRADLKDKVMRYQEECAGVLYQYWMKKQKPNEGLSLNEVKTLLEPISLSCQVLQEAKKDVERKLERAVWALRNMQKSEYNEVKVLRDKGWSWNQICTGHSFRSPRSLSYQFRRFDLKEVA